MQKLNSSDTTFKRQIIFNHDLYPKPYISYFICPAPSLPELLHFIFFPSSRHHSSLHLSNLMSFLTSCPFHRIYTVIIYTCRQFLPLEMRIRMGPDL